MTTSRGCFRRFLSCNVTTYVQKGKETGDKLAEDLSNIDWNTKQAEASQKGKAKNVSEKIDNLNLVGEDREAVVKTRVNQGVFKDRLLSRYKRCCLCNISNKDFLIASHIKPWSKSEYDERLDDDNGFLFCPNHDKLYISTS